MDYTYQGKWQTSKSTVERKASPCSYQLQNLPQQNYRTPIEKGVYVNKTHFPDSTEVGYDE